MILEWLKYVMGYPRFGCDFNLTTACLMAGERRARHLRPEFIRVDLPISLPWRRIDGHEAGTMAGEIIWTEAPSAHLGTFRETEEAWAKCAIRESLITSAQTMATLDLQPYCVQYDPTQIENFGIVPYELGMCRQRIVQVCYPIPGWKLKRFTP